jgi:hypothetical protein
MIPALVRSALESVVSRMLSTVCLGGMVAWPVALT